MDFKKDLEKNEQTSENEALSDDALDAVSGGDGSSMVGDIKDAAKAANAATNATSGASGVGVGVGVEITKMEGKGNTTTIGSNNRELNLGNVKGEGFSLSIS